MRTHPERTIKARMREFCSSLIPEDLFLHLSVAELVERKLCPAWYLASSPVLGRCLPVLQNSSEDLVRLISLGWRVSLSNISL